MRNAVERTIMNNVWSLKKKDSLTVTNDPHVKRISIVRDHTIPIVLPVRGDKKRHVRNILFGFTID